MTLVDWAPPSFTGEPIVVRLTPVRADVLDCLCRGMDNRAITEQLHVTANTVKTHVRELFRTLGANDRAHAVALVHTGQVRVRVSAQVRRWD